MDFNLDGLSDLVVGAPGFDVGGGATGLPNAGRIYGFGGAIIAHLQAPPDPETGAADPGLVSVGDPNIQPSFIVDGSVSGKPVGRVVGVIDPTGNGRITAGAKVGPIGVAPRTFTDPDEIGDPDVIGDPDLREPYRAVLAQTPEMLTLLAISRLHLLDN